jgi:predicted nucleotidyltransferase
MESYKKNESLENFISNFYGELEILFKGNRPQTQIKITDLTKLKRINTKVSFNDLGKEKQCLQKIENIIKKNKDIFYLAFLNGSFGSEDYKIGWSDLDIFLVLSKKTILNHKELKKSQRIIDEINELIYLFNIYQLHGAFLSTEFDLFAHENSLLPIECLKQSQLISAQNEKITLYNMENKKGALDYFNNHIYKSSMQLLKKKHLKLKEKILLIHRIYSFPFSFLQCFGLYSYKRESFDIITKEYRAYFPGIDTFYKKVNEFYLNWDSKKSTTYIIRKLLSKMVNPLFLNRVFFNFEFKIKKEISEGFDLYFNEVNKNKFSKYLKVAYSLFKSYFST